MPLLYRQGERLAIAEPARDSGASQGPRELTFVDEDSFRPYDLAMLLHEAGCAARSDGRSFPNLLRATAGGRTAS